MIGAGGSPVAPTTIQKRNAMKISRLFAGFTLLGMTLAANAHAAQALVPSQPATYIDGVPIYSVPAVPFSSPPTVYNAQTLYAPAPGEAVPKVTFDPPQPELAPAPAPISYSPGPAAYAPQSVDYAPAPVYYTPAPVYDCGPRWYDFLPAISLGFSFGCGHYGHCW